MKFWDSSSIVPLLLAEPQSDLAKLIHQKDPEMIIWALSPTEIYSALYRKIREGTLTESGFSQAEVKFSILKESWSEISQIESVRLRANRLLAVHPLRAADALQLAAALLAFEDRPEGRELVTFDGVLGSAARKEGFTVLTMTDSTENP